MSAQYPLSVNLWVQGRPNTKTGGDPRNLRRDKSVTLPNTPSTQSDVLHKEKVDVG